jgi:O-methyltransferase
VTGYHLTKGPPGAGVLLLKSRLERAERDASRLSFALAANARTLTRLQAPKKPGPPPFPRDYDDAARATIRAVQPYTLTNHEKIYGLIQAVRYLVRADIPGDIVECGVWRGGSMFATARTLLEVGDTTRDLYLFDTFDGMTEPGELDVRFDGRSAAELMATQDRTTNVWAVARLDEVRSRFDEIAYPAEKIHYVVGKVEETVPAELPDQIALLRLDTDWYESTKHELDHAFSRLVPGGVLIIDDYAHWAGSRKATDDFVAGLTEPLLLHRMFDGRIGVRTHEPRVPTRSDP